MFLAILLTFGVFAMNSTDSRHPNHEYELAINNAYFAAIEYSALVLESINGTGRLYTNKTAVNELVPKFRDWYATVLQPFIPVSEYQISIQSARTIMQKYARIFARNDVETACRILRIPRRYPLPDEFQPEEHPTSVQFFSHKASELAGNYLNVILSSDPDVNADYYVPGSSEENLRKIPEAYARIIQDLLPISIEVDSVTMRKIAKSFRSVIQQQLKTDGLVLNHTQEHEAAELLHLLNGNLHCHQLFSITDLNGRTIMMFALTRRYSQFNWNFDRWDLGDKRFALWAFLKVVNRVRAHPSDFIMVEPTDIDFIRLDPNDHAPITLNGLQSYYSEMRRSMIESSASQTNHSVKNQYEPKELDASMSLETNDSTYLNGNSARANEVPEGEEAQVQSDRNTNLFSDSAERKAIRKAIRRNDIANVEELLKSYPELVNGPIDRFGSSALHLAVLSNHKEIVQLLLLNGAKSYKTKTIAPPLHFAVSNGNTDIVQLLLENGIDVNEFNSKKNNTALHIAAFVGDYAMVKLLLRMGADRLAVNHKGRHALFYALNQKRYDQLMDSDGDEGSDDDLSQFTSMLQRLSDYTGPNKQKCLNLQDTVNGGTVLHYAVSHNQYESVRILLKLGINTQLKNFRNQTALDIAKSNNFTEIVEKLERRTVNH